MSSRLVRRCLLIFCLGGLLGSCDSLTTGRQTQVELKPSSDKELFISDDANLLTLSQAEELKALVVDHRAKGVGRIYLCIINQLPEDKTIDQYAYERINQRPLLPGEPNDRVLLLVAIEDKRVRIETSKEVWTLLTDEECQRINRETMIPQFKLRNYFQGIKNGLEEIAKELRRQ